MGSLLFTAHIASAHEDQSAVLEEIVVYGRADAQLGMAKSASSGVVGYDGLRLMPLQRVGDLVESMPGMVATQHSGTGKANQYFLRGFDLDHGTDFRVSVAGVPVNLPTHGHGQGYLDLNFIIPELVETAALRKGPYFADIGDFSAAGSMEFDYYTKVSQPRTTISASDDGYRRGLVLGSTELGSTIATGALNATGALIATGALDVVRNRGPWELDERLRQNRGYLGLTKTMGESQLQLSGQAYSSRWRSTEQLPERALASGLVGFGGSLDPDLGGESHRYALSARYQRSGFSSQLFALVSDFELVSNFTYFLENPIQGDEILQIDDRQVYGANVQRIHTVAPFGFDTTVRWGLGARLDDIDEVGLFTAVAGSRVDGIVRDRVELWQFDGYVDAEVMLGERLRANVGLRFDRLNWRIEDRLSGAAQSNGSLDSISDPDGKTSDNAQQLSPKLSLAYRLSDSLETYANWGRGFHTNDVRSQVGLTNGATRDDSIFTEATGGEFGLRFEADRRFNATLVAFLLDLDSELVFAGDSGTTEPSGRSRRMGIELNGFWQLNPRVAAHANYTRTRARFRDAQTREDHVPGSVESSFSAGIDLRLSNTLISSLRLRHLGKRALTEDNSVRTKGSTLLNTALTYSRSSFEARVEAFNLFDSKAADIEYWFSSRLPGEPADGVEDRHAQPLAPRSLRLSLSWLMGAGNNGS